MNKVCFTGRKRGAIGVTYTMVVEVLNDPHKDIEACRLELYDLGFESVTKLRAFPDDRKLLVWKVLLDGSLIDVVYFNAQHDSAYVKQALIEHYGFSPMIQVSKLGVVSTATT